MSGRVGDGLSDEQKALIAEIARDATAESSHRIAERAIANWEETRPKWYDVRKRLDAATALVIALGLVGTVVVNLFVWRDRNLLQEAPHYLLNTDGRIMTAVEGWAASDKFPNHTRVAIARIAADPPDDEPSPLTDLVKTTLASNPVMVFRGSMTFRKSEKVTAIDQGCFAIVSYLQQLEIDGASDPIGSDGAVGARDDAATPLHGDCQVFASLMSGTVLDVPFIARLNGSDRNRQDNVTLVLQVRRKIEGENDAEVEDLRSTLNGLVVEYDSLDPNLQDAGPFDVPRSRITNPNGFTKQNDGFWKASLNGITAGVVIQSDDDKTFEHYHVVSVKLDEGARFLPNEVISVTAFIFVNTREAE